MCGKRNTHRVFTEKWKVSDSEFRVYFYKYKVYRYLLRDIYLYGSNILYIRRFNINKSEYDLGT